MKTRTVLIMGAGGALGGALANEFSRLNYRVFGIRRHHSKDQDEESCNFQQLYRCDSGDADAIDGIVKEIQGKHGVIDVLIHNAAHLITKPFLELSIDDFSESWRVSVAGAVMGSRAVLPGMLRHKSGTIIFSGATASLRGTSNFAAFCSAKFALRGLSQSLAREYQSQGIHVAHVVIDGLLRGSRSVARFGGHEDTAISPMEVANAYRWLVEQPSSAWTLELDIRSRAERF